MDRSHRFLQCSACDLIFTDPMPAVNGRWYQEQVMYKVRDQLMNGGLQWNHQQFLQDRPGHGGRLLDVGCGTGEFLAAAHSTGYQITGFDFDPGAIQTAQKRFQMENLFTGDLFEFRDKYRKEPFQVVTAFEVLEHSPQPGDFLAALRDLTSPGGFLAISVPNRDRWPAFRYDWDYPPNHLTRWSRSALAGLLGKNGFRVLRTATGWRQGEGFLHQHLQFGVVTRLMRRNGSSENAGSVAVASNAYRLKSAAIKCLALPVNLGLQLAGETGMTLYLLAQKEPHRG